MNKGVSYSEFYEILLNLREYFHSYGRIDDSNAKLDEITKLIAISYSLAKRNINFNLEYVKKIAKKYTKKTDNIAEGLRKTFEEEAKQPIFQNEDGTNIFGAEPSLNIQPTENELAEKLVCEISKIDFIYLIDQQNYSNFDLINECFGHFVRDNFRNNKEDAQYMTPLEIVEPVLNIIFNDMENDGVFSSTQSLENFSIMDPTCGVGTLLVQSSNHFTKYVTEHISDKDERDNIIANFRACSMIGQDKVDRMVRLSKINTLLLGGNMSNINIGNSIVGKSSISKYKGKIDFIFTNPPFGAEYSKSELDFNDYPMLATINTSSIDLPSELLMLDKCISLLKDNGYLAIVLPDAVFSSKGLYAAYRDQLLGNVDIKAIIELPSVTFAQAGTRTNTCILYLRKCPPKNSSIYMGICKDVGYLVKERSGVPVKIESGRNEMPAISSTIINDSNSTHKITGSEILSQSPSVTLIPDSKLIENILNPTFYAADRLEAVSNITCSIKDGYVTKKLSDIVDFVTKARSSKKVSENVKHISVLHINSNLTINMDEVMKFHPVGAGRECNEGDILFSKINPQIPRMAVVPQSQYDLVCSNEFEIMRPKDQRFTYCICMLLRSNAVSKQIINLTSGTSSSHNRIKTDQLKNILIPVPVSQKAIKEMKELNDTLSAANNAVYKSEKQMSDALNYLNKIA